MNKLIVTCGTSQIDTTTLKAIDAEGGVYMEFREGVLGSLTAFCYSSVGEDFIQPGDGIHHWIISSVDHLTRQFMGNFASLDQRIGEMDQNPLGAELTTLHQMRTREDGFQWDPREDQVVLLSSETRRGYCATYFVKQVLHALYQVPEEKVCIDIVPGLCEEVEDVDITLYTFAEVVLDYLDLEDDKRSPYEHYAVLMSGGFKSVIPVLTLLSFFFGIELIYIFEASQTLLSLNPSVELDSESDREFWKGVWEGLKQRSLTNRAAYYRALLDARLKFPYRSFS